MYRIQISVNEFVVITFHSNIPSEVAIIKIEIIVIFWSSNVSIYITHTQVDRLAIVTESDA